MTQSNWPNQMPPQPPQPFYGEYPPPKKGMGTGCIVAIVCAVVAVPVGALLLSILLPAFNHVREEALKAKCSANLSRIYAACITYSNANNGNYPDSITAMLKGTAYPPDILVCPSSNDQKWTQGSSAITDDTQLQNAHCLSYVYVGKGLTSNSPSKSVLAYEPIENHHGKGAHVLYLDGSTVFLKQAEFDRMIDQLRTPQPSPGAFKSY